MPCATMRVVQRQPVKINKEVKDKPKPVKPKMPGKADTKKIVKAQAKRFGWTVKEKNGWTLVLAKPNSNDLINVEIKKRGIVSFDVPGMISAPNHSNAENFLRDVTSALGARVINVIHKMSHAMMHAAGIHHHH